jgi:hypothetical protein
MPDLKQQRKNLAHHKLINRENMKHTSLILAVLLFCGGFLAEAQTPNAPTNLVVTPINTGAMIQFTAPTSDGGSPITNYQYSTNNGSSWITPASAVTESPLIFTSGLTNCTSYQVRIRAVNVNGDGTVSDAATLIPAPSIASGAVNWVTRTTASDTWWRSVTYGNGIFVAVAQAREGSRIMTSPDGITWTARTAPVTNAWQSVTYGNGTFVAVSADGASRIISSPDGITWTAHTAPVNNQWWSVTYGNGLFVAVANSGTGNRVMTSPDGATWTARSSAADNQWNSVTFGNGIFIAVAGTGTGNRVMRSIDGINWNTFNASSDLNWNSITYGNNRFVALAVNGVMTSLDGFIWTNSPPLPNFNGWRGLTYGNGLFVAVGNAGEGQRIMTSPNGETWTLRSSAADLDWTAITYGNGQYVAVGNSIDNDGVMTSSIYTPAANAPVISSITLGNRTATTATAIVNFSTSASVYATPISNIQYSINNGTNWTTPSPAVLSSPISIPNLNIGTSYPIRVRAVNSAGNSCQSNVSSFNPPQGIASAPTDLVVTPINTGGMIQFTPPADFGGSAITNYQYSTDSGATWVTPSPAVTESPLIISSGLTNCTPYQVRLRAVNTTGNGTASLSSTLIPSEAAAGGVSWNLRSTSGVAENNWGSVAYGNGIFVAVAYTGTGNRVMTSPDGFTWTERTSAGDSDWRSVTFGNGLFVAVASAGTSRVMTSPDGITWTLRSTLNNEWRSVAFGNGTFVAVASSGTNNRVMTSTNGTTWTARTSAANNLWQSVTYGNNLFVAVSSDGTSRVMTSIDGTTWTLRTAAAANEWQSVTFGNGTYVAVSSSGTGNRVMTSTNGTTWTSRTSAANNNWRSVTYGDGVFVAVALSGTGNRVMTSPDGTTWTIRTSAANNSWTSVTYGQALFVAVSFDGIARVMTSSLYSPSAFAPVISDISSGPNRSAVVSFSTDVPPVAGNISNYEYSTDNGTSWTPRTPAGSSSPLTIPNLTPGTNYQIRLRALNSGGASCPSGVQAFSLPITVADPPTDLNIIPLNTGALVQFTPPANDGNSNITNYQYSTDNGDTWITPSPALTESPLFISSGLTNCTNYQLQLRTVNAAGASSPSVAATLTPNINAEGFNWTSRTTSVNNNWISVTYGKGLFVAISNTGTGNRVMTSPDGVTWTSRSSAGDIGWSSVTYGNGTFVAVAGSGSGQVMTSLDGITWNARTASEVNAWQSVTYGNGLFVAVARSSTGNTVMTSPDGITWTSRTASANIFWNAVTFGNGRFVAVGLAGSPNNALMTSTDGITWTGLNPPRNVEWQSVTYGNGTFVAVSGASTDNTVMTSTDGTNWTLRTPANNNFWRSVTYGNGLFVAIALTGTGNRVMTSPDGITWTARTSAADNSWSSVVYGNGRFVAVASSGTNNRVMTSDRFIPAPNPPVVSDIVYNSGSAVVTFSSSIPTFATAISNIQYSIDNGTNWVTPAPAVTTSPLTITGLAIGASYPIRLKAVNTAGASCLSAPFSTCATSFSTTNVSVCSNQVPYSWNGNNYSTSGSFEVTLTNAEGCDSIATLVLTVNNTSTSTTNTTVCSNQLPFSWNGNDYNSSGSYNVTLTNAVACDSIATLVLTVNNTSSSTTNAAVCSNELPFTWNGNDYNTSGSYNVTLTNSVACDSIATLVLTVNSTSASTTNATVCSDELPFIWNSNNYNTSGTYTVTLPNSVACDSVATLNLTVSEIATWYLDADGDGWYVSTQSSCESPGIGWVNTLPSGGSGDCNDNNFNVNPGVSEVCSNGIDDNCNDFIDEGCAVDPLITTSLGAISGPVSVACTGVQDVAFSVAAVPNATLYSWTGTGGITVVSGQGTTQVLVDFPLGFSSGTLRVRASNNSSQSNERVITIRSSPSGSPGAISGSSGNICGGTSEAYSINPVANSESYEWILAGSGASIASGQGSTSVTLNFNAGFSSVILQVRSVNSCGASGWRTLTISSGVDALGNPGAISGLSQSCPAAIQNYSIPAISGATNYIWRATGGITVSGGQGTNAAEMTFPVGFTSGSIFVRAANACGETRESRINISGLSKAPGAISGQAAQVCANSIKTYSIAPVAGALSYQWSATGDISLSEDNGTEATYAFGPAFVSGTIQVQAVSACGVSASRSLTIRSNVPSVPGVISGITAGLCPNQSAVFSISPIISATSYLWSFDGDMEVLAGQGSTTATYAAGAAFEVGQVRVQAVNGCGSSPARTLNVRSTPARPGALAGPGPNVLKGSTGLSYSISPVASATSYIWTGTGGIDIVSGNGTNIIAVDFPVNFEKGNLAVRAVNGCGEGASRGRAISGIDELPFLRGKSYDAAPEIQVYPNPAKDKVIVQGSGITEIHLYDLSGKLLQAHRYQDAYQEEIKLDYPQGMYIIQVFGAGWQSQHKVVVQ